MTLLAQADETDAGQESLSDYISDVMPSELATGDYWALVKDVWNKGVGGNDFGDILIAIGVLIAFLLVRQIFSRFVLKRVEKVADRGSNRLDQRVVTALEGPVRAIPFVIGVFFATEYLTLNGTLREMATALNRSLIVFLIFWALYRMVEPFSFLLGKVERVFTSAMVEWLIKAIKLLFALIGFATVLEIWGIQVAPIIAGFGLLGVAVALGAQDLFKNLIAGILILVERRFSTGEWIAVDGVVEGTVESIGFRSTFVRRFDLAPVFVPNAQLSDVAVTNFSRMLHRRIYWMIGLEYRTSIDQLRQIRDEIEAYILNSDEFVHPDHGTMIVRVDRFSDSSIDIMVYCFTKTKKWLEWMEIKEAFAYRVKEIVEGAGAGFAFPSQSVYLETMPSGTPDPSKPEQFNPPEGKSAKKGRSKKAPARKADATEADAGNADAGDTKNREA